MRTKNRKYLYSQDLEPVSKEIAFNNSFRHYKNFYFYTLEQVLPSDLPGRRELSECTFNNPIDQEARGQLAQILDLERPITYDRERFKLLESTLVRDYKAHHLFLRGVKKFYQSRLVKRNPVFNDCVLASNKINLHQKVPMSPKLRKAYAKIFGEDQSRRFIDYHEQPGSLQWQMENSTYPNWSHWPAKIIDINFFLERGNFKMVDLNSPTGYKDIQDYLFSVADDVGLSGEIKDYQNVASIGERQQQKIQEQIVENFRRLEQLQVQETTASMATVTLETSPGMQEQDGREQVAASSSSRGEFHEQVPVTHPPFGSLAIYHGTGASSSFGFGISALLWVTYLNFKIYEFFVPQKETSTNLKDCLFKCGEQKISKETTFEPTLIKLELNSNDKPRNCTEKLY